MNIAETRAYKYALFCVNESDGRVGRYVKKQCEKWLVIADGKCPDAYVSMREYKRVSGILRLMVHPDLNCPMYSGLEDYAIPQLGQIIK